MALTVKELFEKRKASSDRLQQLRDAAYIGPDGKKLPDDAPREWNTEERAEWTKVNTEYDDLTRQIQVEQRMEQIRTEQTTIQTPAFDPRALPYDGKKAKKDLTKEERRAAKQQKRAFQKHGWNARHVSEEMRANVIQGWCRTQLGKSVKSEHVAAARSMGLSDRLFKSRELPLNLMSTRNVRGLTANVANRMSGLSAEQRAQFVNVPISGGVTVPEGFMYNLEIALLAYANVRLYADVIRTDSGADLPWPEVNDTTVKGYRVQETTAVTEKDLTWGAQILHAYKYTSGMVQLPVELLEDSAFNLAEELGELFGIRIGRIQADEFTFGAGNGMPTGFVIGAMQGVQATSPTALAGDDILTLKHSVDPAYRTPGVGFVMHDQILLAVKKLKDGSGRYLFKDGLQGLGVGYPMTLDSDPIWINQSMASTIVSGNKTMVYGQLKKIIVRDVSQIRMRRLVERYADQDLEGFVMFSRADCQLLDAGTNPIKYMVH
jgi:HK97 family phage major capsid protein